MPCVSRSCENFAGGCDIHLLPKAETQTGCVPLLAVARVPTRRGQEPCGQGGGGGAGARRRAGHQGQSSWAHGFLEAGLVAPKFNGFVQQTPHVNLRIVCHLANRLEPTVTVCQSRRWLVSGWRNTPAQPSVLADTMYLSISFKKSTPPQNCHLNIQLVIVNNEFTICGGVDFLKII